MHTAPHGPGAFLAGLFHTSGGRSAGHRSSTFHTRVRSLVRSTRLNLGGASPLIGRGLDVIGALPPPISATVEALTGLATVAAATSRDLNQLGAAARVSGGTTSQVSRLEGMGLSPAQITGLASQFRQRITTDPFAASYANGMGISALPGPFGNVNQAGDLLKAGDALAHMTNAEERLRAARALGLESLLQYAALSEQTRAAMKADAAVRAAIADPQTLAQANELQFALSRVKENFLGLVDALGKPFLSALTDAVTKLAEVLRTAAQWVNQHQTQTAHWVGGAVGGAVGLKVGSMTGNPILTLLFGAAGATIGVKLADALVQATQQNTNATQQNTQATQQNTRVMQSGLYGSGERGRGALGRGQSGMFLERALEMKALTFGAFSL